MLCLRIVTNTELFSFCFAEEETKGELPPALNVGSCRATTLSVEFREGTAGAFKDAPRPGTIPIRQPESLPSDIQSLSHQAMTQTTNKMSVGIDPDCTAIVTAGICNH
jgi:hypothetical protein